MNKRTILADKMYLMLAALLLAPAAHADKRDKIKRQREKQQQAIIDQMFDNPVWEVTQDDERREATDQHD